MLKQVKSTTLVDQVSASLLEYIHTHNLRARDTLPSIQELETGFGVSRPVIREALIALAARGILEVSNGKKATIKPITSEPLVSYFHFALHIEDSAVSEFMEIRRGLEVQSAMLAATRHTEADLAEIQHCFAELQKHLYDVDQFSEHDVALHLAIARATHNKMLFHLIDSIRETIKETIREGRLRRLTNDQLQTVQNLHEALVLAIATRDPQRAGQAMNEHFDAIAMSLGGKNED